MPNIAMSRFNQQTLETLRSRADLVEIVGEHVRLRRSGRNYLGLCPFHDERTASFTVSPERGFFHCFGCGAGGTVFDFLMRTEGVAFPEAVRLLAGRYGVALIETAPAATREDTAREAIYRVGEFAREFFARLLWESQEGKAARDYLLKRAITEKTAKECKLGFAPAGSAALTAAARKKGLLEAAAKAGLVRPDGADGLRDMFRARLMFPIHDAQGRVIAFGGRSLDDSAPKYLNSPESPVFSKGRTLFGLDQARRAIVATDRAIVVEGYIDALALWQGGFRETVATLGTALTVEHLRTLGRHTRNVLACFDGDDAGRAASLRALPIFLGAGMLGRAVFLPNGFDPDKLVAEQGAAAFASLLDCADLLIHYFVKNEAAKARGSVEGRAGAARRVAEMLRKVRDPFEFDLLARQAAEMLAVDEQLLRRQGDPGAAAVRVSAPGPATTRITDAAELARIGLLAAALAHPELRSEIAAGLAPDDAQESDLNAIITEICQTQITDAECHALLSTQLSAAQQSHISLLMVGPRKGEPQVGDLQTARRMIADFHQTLKRMRHRRRIDQAPRLAKELQTQGDQARADQAAQDLIAFRRANEPQ
jgi:DNA primase